jgi:hypothetical protein
MNEITNELNILVGLAGILYVIVKSIKVLQIWCECDLEIKHNNNTMLNKILTSPPMIYAVDKLRNILERLAKWDIERKRKRRDKRLAKSGITVID